MAPSFIRRLITRYLTKISGTRASKKEESQRLDDRYHHLAPASQWISLLTTLVLLADAEVTRGSVRIWQSADAKVGVRNQAEDEKGVRVLERGKPIERELKGGEAHTYEIVLIQGQYFKVVVDHKGISVVVTLTGPDTKQVMEVNTSDSPQGSGQVEQVVGVTGGYRLKVQSQQKGGFAGRYEIRVVELRPATEDDRALEAARNLSRESERLYRAGKYDEALPLAQKALAVREKILGPDHLDVSQSLNSVASIYHFKGDYEKTEPLWQRSLAIREKALGPDHPDVAKSLNNLAILYSSKGDYAKAEPLWQRSLAIFEKALGPRHPLVGRGLNNLARTYLHKQDSAKAETLYERALAILEEVLGPDHPDVARSLTGLAEISSRKGDLTKGDALFQRSLAIREKALGPNHPEVAHSLNNLAINYSRKGDYAKAEALYQRSLAIRDKAYGPDHPDVAQSLINLAINYYRAGDYVKAEPLYQRSLAIFEKTLGPNHPNVAVSLNFLSRLYRVKGDTARAITYQTRASAVTERNITLNNASGSERQKLAYLATLSDETDQTISLHLQVAPTTPDTLRLAFNTILRRKGRALDAMTDSISTLRRNFNTRDRRLLDQWAEARSRLANLVLGATGDSDPAKYRAEVKLLEAQVEDLESEISHRSVEFRVQAQPVALEAVQSALPRNAALIEFALYHPFNATYRKESEVFGEPRYVAYILRTQGSPQWVDLGEVKRIDESVELLRKALRNPKRTEVRKLARIVDAKVMMPVRKLLGQTRRLLISPDGALNLIPFAALVDERGEYLVKQFSFSYLTSGRDLLRLQLKTRNKQDAMVVADPDFGGDTTPCSERKLKLLKAAVDFSQVLFCPLSATAGEAEALQALMPEATLLTKQRATEAAVKQAAGPEILHIATHGFFLEDVMINPGTVAGDAQSRAAMRVENPLLRSGLALAGANLHKSGDDDGVLTALEAAGLDLWGTKLVVLSACDTGVGEVKNGDGVYGLRRALVLAGSESQVMSLWPVSDTATRDLMIGYYKGLQVGEGRGEALRQVQLRMLASKKRQHPYYWASFIQSGEWANMDGKR